LVWIQFVGCLAIIVVAGTQVAKYGDLIAEKTGLGRVWIGLVLLATVTSLPELATGISSVTLVGKPDLTIGNIFGAGLINLVIIAVVDLVYTRGPVLHLLGTGVVLSTVLSVTLIAAAATSLFLAQNILTVALFGRVGIYSIVLFCLFLLAQYMIFRFQSSGSDETQENETGAPKHQNISLKRGVTFFVIAAAAIVGAGAWLASIGDQISELTGLGTSFVGTLFLAISTTAPEIIVSLSAVRMGAVGMAVGNAVGSNLFNIGVIIFIDDLFYSSGPILQGVSIEHIITALFAILMSSIVIIGIIFRPRFWLRIWVGVDTTALVILYIGAIVTIYFLGSSV
jgi:cation:H+ antiporter